MVSQLVHRVVYISLPNNLLKLLIMRNAFTYLTQSLWLGVCFDSGKPMWRNCFLSWFSHRTRHSSTEEKCDPCQSNYLSKSLKSELRSSLTSKILPKTKSKIAWCNPLCECNAFVVWLETKVAILWLGVWMCFPKKVPLHLVSFLFPSFHFTNDSINCISFNFTPYICGCTPCAVTDFQLFCISFLLSLFLSPPCLSLPLCISLGSLLLRILRTLEKVHRKVNGKNSNSIERCLEFILIRIELCNENEFQLCNAICGREREQKNREKI